MKEIKVCKKCGKEFKDSVYRNAYCSTKCLQESRPVRLEHSNVYYIEYVKKMKELKRKGIPAKDWMKQYA